MAACGRGCVKTRNISKSGVRDPYPIVNPGLQRILCGRILKKKIGATFSHGLDPKRTSVKVSFLSINSMVDAYCCLEGPKNAATLSSMVSRFLTSHSHITNESHPNSAKAWRCWLSRTWLPRSFRIQYSRLPLGRPLRRHFPFRC